MSISMNEPYTGPYNAYVILPNPELGNPQQINLRTAYKQTMDGKIHTNKKTSPTSKLVLTFNTLELTEIELFKHFYEDTLGKEIRYVDYDSLNWRVRIVMDSLTVTTERITCSYGMTVELSGVKV